MAVGYEAHIINERANIPRAIRIWPYNGAPYDRQRAPASWFFVDLLYVVKTKKINNIITDWLLPPKLQTI